jgi:hypothetical protein
MTHQIEHEPNGLVISFSGLVTGDEIFALNEYLVVQETFPQWHYQIWDFSHVERIEISSEQLRSFAIQDSIAAQKNPDLKVGIIPRRKLPSGLDRIFHIFEEAWEGFESKTFPTVEAARKWAKPSLK